MHRLKYRHLPFLLILLAAPACGGDDAPATPTTPTTPATVTEPPFSGTINQNGAATHTFMANRSGEVRATLTMVSPDSSVPIGLSLGTWSFAGACQIVLANDKALQGTVVIGNATSAGNLCVRVYDVGAITQPTTYEVLVVHP